MFFFSNGEVLNELTKKFFILVHFKSLELIFFNSSTYDEVLNQIYPKSFILLPLSAHKLKSDFIQNLELCYVLMLLIEKFLQPCCSVEWALTQNLSFWCVSVLLNWNFLHLWWIFNDTVLKISWIQTFLPPWWSIRWAFIKNPSFWCISDCRIENNFPQPWWIFNDIVLKKARSF